MDLNLLLTRFPHYLHKQTSTKLAIADCAAASGQLNLAYIYERNAELGSQDFDYVAKGKLRERLGELTDREREIGLAFARYVAYGRADEA